VIRWIERKLNDYLNQLLNTDDDYIIAIDTDSVVGNTIIEVNGKKITIEDYFDNLPNNFIKNDEYNDDYVKKVCGDKSLCFHDDKICSRNIKYAMKHKGELISVKPKEILENDSILYK